MICGRSGFRTGREAIRFEHMLQLPPSRNDDGVESQARAPLGVPVACARRNGGGLVRRRFVAAWLGLLAALFVLRVVYITQAGPYVRHVDEEFLSRAAGKIVDSGDLAPRFYIYPSLPSYLSALGYAIGSVFDSALDEARPAAVKVSYAPTYQPPNRGFAARFLFCLLGTLAVAFASLAVARLANDPGALVLAPLVALMSPLLAIHTWTYLNVDIVGTCFAIASLAAFCIQPRGQLSWWRTAAAGLLCGLAVGSKYTLGLAIVPSGLIVLLTAEVPWKHRILHLALLGTTLIAGFLSAVPYFIPHFDRYMHAIAAEVKHYKLGHAGFTSEPGLEHLGVQLRALVGEFSLVGTALGLLGGVVLVRQSRRRGPALLAFPVLLLLFISLQRINFQRNLLAVYVLFAALIALGTVTLGRLMAERAATCLDKSLRAWTPAAVAAALFALFAVSLPGPRLAEQLTVPTESRVEVVDWIRTHVPEQSTLIVPSQLFLADDALRDDYRIVYVDVFKADRTRTVFKNNPGQYVLMPTFGFDPRWPKQGRLASILEQKDRGQGQVLKTFGANPLLVNYPLPVHNGNPLLALLRL